MTTFQIVMVALACFVVGFCVRHLLQAESGVLVINKNDPSKPMFELHFTGDIDISNPPGSVLFRVEVR